MVIKLLSASIRNYYYVLCATSSRLLLTQHLVLSE